MLVNDVRKKRDSHCRKVGWSGIARRLTCGDDLYPALMLHGDGSPEQQASADLMHSQAAMTRSAIQRAELALHQIEVVRQAGRKAAGRPAQNAPRHRLTKPRRPPTNGRGIWTAYSHVLTPKQGKCN